MLKKGIGSLVAATLLSTMVGQGVSFAAVNQEQTHTTSVGQVEGATSSKPMVLLQTQKAVNNATQLQTGTPTAAGQGQAGSAAVAQVQSAVTSGPAALNQSAWTSVNLFEKQNVNSSGQQQSTGAGNSLHQSTVTASPSQIVQGQIGVTSSIQFQGSVAGGPTIQNQITHRSSTQYQAAMNIPGK